MCALYITSSWKMKFWWNTCLNFCMFTINQLSMSTSSPESLNVTEMQEVQNCLGSFSHTKKLTTNKKQTTKKLSLCKSLSTWLSSITKQKLKHAPAVANKSCCMQHVEHSSSFDTLSLQLATIRNLLTCFLLQCAWLQNGSPALQLPKLSCSLNQVHRILFLPTDHKLQYFP